MTRVELATAPAQPRKNRRPSAPLEPGERYAIGAKLGAGGMGEVMAAHDLQIGRDVAIKRLHASAPSPTAMARFLREARIQGRLEHPSIAPVYELGFDDDGRPFFAMKKVAGTTLAEILREPAVRDQYSRARLLRAFADVCLAIEFAHAHGVIHRDIKPANILLGSYGEVYVIDWGVARLIGDTHADASTESVPAIEARLTNNGTAVGTPGYMAPEQVRGQVDLDARVDVYALGCILFEILTGTPLHPRGRAGMQSAVDGVVARPSTRSDDIAPELDLLCERATATDRGARIATARELGDAVQRYLDGDRDADLRSRHAAVHVAAARSAQAIDDEAHRRIAIREAGRALALDPTSEEAAELVRCLVLSPPKITPAEVSRELSELDRRVAHRQTLVGVIVHVGLLAFAAALWLAGMGGASLAGFTGFAALRIASGLYEFRRADARPIALNYLLSALVIAMLARMFTPFLVAPGIAAVTLMVFAFHPVAARRGVLLGAWLACVLAVAGVWAAEEIGMLAPTMQETHGTILLSSPVTGIQALPADLGLFGHSLLLLTVAALLAGTAARTQRLARERLHVQAWQFSQLVSLGQALRGTRGAKRRLDLSASTISPSETA